MEILRNLSGGRKNIMTKGWRDLGCVYSNFQAFTFLLASSRMNEHNILL